MMNPLRSLLLAVVSLLVGVTIGLVVAEPFLESVFALFAAEKPDLVPVDFDPFDPCLWGAISPHDLCA